MGREKTALNLVLSLARAIDKVLVQLLSMNKVSRFIPSHDMTIICSDFSSWG